MEAAATIRSFEGTHHLANGILNRASLPQGPVVGRRPITFRMKPKWSLMASAKASVTTVAAKSESEKVSVPLNNKTLQTSTFPNGFEKLVLEVCDETDIAEVKLKVGEFEMHLKRSVGAQNSLAPVVSPTTAPPIPSEPMVESAPFTQPATPKKSSPIATNHFTNISSAGASKLAALEASSPNAAYVLVSSPTVGSFRSGRTVQGKKQRPSCKEGDLIKEGQTIGYLDQFGSELPVKSDVAGEVLKVLFKDGEAVGFGDPLIAVLSWDK